MNSINHNTGAVNRTVAVLEAIKGRKNPPGKSKKQQIDLEILTGDLDLPAVAGQPCITNDGTIRMMNANEAIMFMNRRKLDPDAALAIKDTVSGFVVYMTTFFE